MKDIVAKKTDANVIAVNVIWDSLHSERTNRQYVPFLNDNKEILLDLEGITIPVTGFANELPVLRESLEQYALSLVVSESYYDSLGFNLEANEYFYTIKVEDGERYDVVKENLQKLLLVYPDYVFEGRIEERENELEIQKGLRMIIYAFTGLLTCIGLANIFASTLGQIHQRKREFARYFADGTSGTSFAYRRGKLDNQRIEGNIPDMLNAAIKFVRKNMRTKTIINPENGVREDRPDYPTIAIREAIINALVHRDYSIHTEGMPIQIIMYEGRMEIRNPGGLYGRIRVDQLGKVQPDTRNPVLASSVEVLGITENRYSGIPTIKKEMKKYNLREPEFLDERGNFVVKFYKEVAQNEAEEIVDEETNNLLIFCKTPRTRQEICDYLGLSSVTYAIQKHVNEIRLK